MAGCCVLEGDAEAASRRARLTALSVLANFAGNLEASMTAWLELLARLLRQSKQGVSSSLLAL